MKLAPLDLSSFDDAPMKASIIPGLAEISDYTYLSAIKTMGYPSRTITVVCYRSGSISTRNYELEDFIDLWGVDSSYNLNNKEVA